MIKYSLLDTPSVSEDVLVENVTVRLEEGLFDKTIITFDPIKLTDDGARISYGLVIKSLIKHGVDVLPKDGGNPPISEVVEQPELNILYTHADDIFNDVLILMKDNIKFGANNDY